MHSPQKKLWHIFIIIVFMQVTHIISKKSSLHHLWPAVSVWNHWHLGNNLCLFTDALSQSRFSPHAWWEPTFIDFVSNKNFPRLIDVCHDYFSLFCRFSASKFWLPSILTHPTSICLADELKEHELSIASC